MGMDELRIEALLRHQGGGAVRRALAFAANAKDVDVVAHKIGQIDRHRLRRKRREADLPATIVTMRAASFSALGAPEHSSTYCTPFPWVRRCTASTGSSRPTLTTASAPSFSPSRGVRRGCRSRWRAWRPTPWLRRRP